VQEKESITDILQDLLAAQTQSPIIRLGNVDSAIGTTEISISFENKSILECIEELRKIVGGFYYVDVNRFLHWKRRIGNDAGHWLRLDHNMSSVEVYQDFRQVKTRYIGYGAGISNDTRLSSEQNDATAQSSYGVIVGAFSQQRVNEQDTLDAMTEAELARWSAPATSYRIGVVDLSQVDSDRYSFEALMLVPGTRVNVICDAPAVDIVSRVRSVKWDLTDPAHVEVEFSDPESGPVAWGGDDGTHEPDVVDRIVDLVKRAEDAVSPESVAVGIARSMDPATDDVTDILTRDNYAGREAEDLAVPYGTAGNEDVDEFSDAMIDRIIDAKTDPAHPLHDTLEDAFGTLGIYWLGEVLALPAVPAAEGMYVCKWVSTGLGTGNDKLWTANGGDDRWTCMQVLTSLSGTPV
jgi:hypothetical protein